MNEEFTAPEVQILRKVSETLIDICTQLKRIPDSEELQESLATLSELTYDLAEVIDQHTKPLTKQEQTEEDEFETDELAKQYDPKNEDEPKEWKC